MSISVGQIFLNAVNKSDFSDAGYEQWLQKLQNRSCFVSEFHPTTENRMITLSTCAYEFNNARFVLHGVFEAAQTAADRYLKQLKTG